MDPLEISFSLTHKDYARAVRAFALRRPVWVVTIVIYLIMMASLIFLGLRSLSASLANEGSATSIACSSYSLLMCAATLIFMYLPFRLLVLFPYLAGRQAKKHEDKLDPIIWGMEEDRLRFTSPQGKSEMEWTAFGKVVETKQYYLPAYAMNKRLVEIIPKRAFESPDQELLFRRYVEKYIGPIK